MKPSVPGLLLLERFLITASISVLVIGLQKTKRLSEEALEIAVKRREEKSKGEKDRYLEKFNLPRLSQEDIEIMNNPITSTENKTVIQNLPQKQKLRIRWLHR